MATNTRLGIPVNLPDGATYDLLLINYADSFPEGKIEFALNDTPRKITGIQKVAQTFLRVLFSSKGSDVLNTSLGTSFTDLTVNANRTSVDRDLFIAISNAIRDAEKQTISILNSVTADDASKLDKINILGLDTSNESVIIYIGMRTVAGEAAQVAVPFPELDIPLSQG